MTRHWSGVTDLVEPDAATLAVASVTAAVGPARHVVVGALELVAVIGFGGVLACAAGLEWVLA